MAQLQGITLSRRQTLLALTYAVTVGPLTFYGCGGGNGKGGGTGGLTRKGVKGAAHVPTALAGRTAEMRLYTGAGDTLLAADGTFAVDTLADAPTLATLMLDDKPVLVGFLDAQAATNLLDSAAAAAALLFAAVGGWSFSSDQRQAVIALVAKDPTTASLAATITDRLATDPYALYNQDPQIVAALDAAVKVLAPGRSAYSRAATKQAAAARVGSATRVPSGSTTRAADPPPQLLLGPAGLINGMEVVQDGDLVPGFSVINHQRRARHAHLYRVGVVDKQGVETRYPLAVPIGDILTVSATQKLGLLNAIGDVLSATSPWSPTQSSRVPLPAEPNTRKTMYEIVALSPAYKTAEPAFFSESRYSAEAANWRKEVGDLNEAAFFDLGFSLLLEALGMGGLKASEAAFAEAIANVKNFGGNDLVSLLVRARGGAPVGESLLAFIRLVISSDTLSSGYLAAITPIYRIANAQLAADAQLGALKSQTLLRFRGALRVLLIVGLIASALDIGAQIHDLDGGDTGNLYNADVYVPTLVLTPQSATISPGDSVTLTASIPGAVNANLVYNWSVSGSDLANLRDTASGKVGTALDSVGGSVVLATTPSTTGTLTVAVEAFDTTGGGHNSLGTAAATIKTKSDISRGDVKIEFRSLSPGGTSLLPTTRTFGSFDTPNVGQYQGNPVVTAVFSNLLTNADASSFKVAMWFDTPTVKAGTQIKLGKGFNSEVILVLELDGNRDTTVSFQPKSGTLTVLDVSPELLGGFVTFKIEASMITANPNITADIVATGQTLPLEKR